MKEKTKSPGRIFIDKYGDDTAMKYFEALGENARPVTVHLFDDKDRAIFERGIKTRIRLPHWTGNTLYWHDELKRLVEVDKDDLGFVKSIRITSGHFNYGGQIFVHGWQKHVYVWAYRVEWIPTPNENAGRGFSMPDDDEY